MKALFHFCLLAGLLVLGHDSLLSFHRKKPLNTSGDFHVFAAVKIYSNLAEVIVPLGKLPLEFSSDDWEDIREDSVTLVGPNVTISKQTVTEQKKSLDNTQVHVRSPTSSNAQTKFVKATLIDEKRSLVKLSDKEISKDPVYLTVSSSDIVYDAQPPQSKYYVNFTYDTSGEVYLSYLRSNLNWKTRYQLNLFEDAKSPVLISMADIRNDGNSNVDIDHAELLGGDINLQLKQSYNKYPTYQELNYAAAPQGTMSPPGDSDQVVVGRGEEVAGLYVFTVSDSFSIAAKTNYLVPMFRPKVTVERYALFSKYSYSRPSAGTSKAQRSYRLSSDRFLSRGNCIIRESDRLVGETSFPDLAAKNKHEFSIGEDADVVLKENVTLISSTSVNDESTRRNSASDHPKRTLSVYSVDASFKNFKKNRPIEVEYQHSLNAISVKLVKPSAAFTQEGTKIKTHLKLAADEEKTVSYKVEVVN